MKDCDKPGSSFSRRDFLRLAGAGRDGIGPRYNRRDIPRSIHSARRESIDKGRDAQHGSVQHPLHSHGPGTFLSTRRIAFRIQPAGPRAIDETGNDFSESPDQLVRMHAVPFGAVYRAAYSAHAHVRQHQLSLDRQHVVRNSHRGRHAASSWLLHRIQGQVASEQGFRDRQHTWHAYENIHQGNGGLRLLRLFRGRRYYRAPSGRLSARRRDRSHVRELVARQGARVGGRWQALVSGCQPGQSPRRHVLRYRCSRLAAPGPDRPHSCGAGTGRSAIRQTMALRPSGESREPIRRAGAAAGAPRFPAFARCACRRNSQRGTPLASASQLLSELHTRRRPEHRSRTRRTRCGGTCRAHHCHSYLRPWRHGRRAPVARQGARYRTANRIRCRWLSPTPPTRGASSAAPSRRTSILARRRLQ